MKSLSSSSSSSSTTEASATAQFYLQEVCLLEFFLSYIRSYSGESLLKSWRSVMSLVKDCHSLNVQANIPISILQKGLQLPQQPPSGTTSSSTVSINVQSLVNFHLLAILHEFLFITSLCEDKRTQKEMQDVANKLIESIITVAGTRLSQSKWTLRRNLEVLPMSGSEQNIPQQQPTSSQRASPVPSQRTSTIYTDAESSTDFDSTSTVVKRNLFRQSGSMSFNQSNTNRHSTTSQSYTDTQSDILHQSSYSNQIDLHQFSASTSSDSLFSGLFSLGLPISGSALTGSDLTTSGQMLFDNFFCVKALYALSEVSVMMS